ncbi:TonB-dependent siderophore receptor [Methylosinus sp. C49]|uniref:TonB-dependent siderophore receptor n=1 Tax=Methylosinus sp. C49 TaxID=2699395 RepID=UPI001379715A|nr:TonB-dependent siderophore receptor [Methylosinus sp. C49]
MSVLFRHAFWGFASLLATTALSEGAAVGQEAASSVLPPVKVDAPQQKIRPRAVPSSATPRVARSRTRGSKHAVQINVGAPSPTGVGPALAGGTGGQGAPAPGSQGYVARQSSTGTKTDTPLLEVPQSISVITRAQMDARNVQREGEAFRYMAGVYSEPYGGDPRATFDAPYVRGFDVSTNGVYRDGLREANGVWSRFITEFYGLERVDVLKGPSSVLYGQGSPGGIVDKITKKPTEEARGEAYVQGGSLDRIQGAFDVSGPVDADKRLLYRLVFMARDSGTQFQYGSGDSAPDIRQYVAPSFTWRPTDATSFTLLGDWLHNRTAGPFTVTLANQVSTRVMLGEPSFNKNDFTQGTIGYRFEHKFDEAWTVRQNMRYGALDFGYNNMTASKISANGTIARNATAIDEQLYSFALDTQSEARVATGPVTHTVLVGVDYQSATYTTRTRGGVGPSLNLYYPVYGQIVTTPSTITSYSHQTATQLGVYAQEQAKFDNWILTFGGRFDNARSTTTNIRAGSVAVKDDSQGSYRAGLNYVFDIGVAPYVAYSRSFLPTTGTDFNGNVFKPTIAEQFEGGVKYQPQFFPATFTAAYFDLTQQNVLTPDPARPATTYKVQTGEVNSRGFEFEAVANPMPGLDMVAAYTYNPVHVTKDNATSNGTSNVGKRPAYIARNMASLWADYTLQDGDFRGFGLGAGVRFVGPTYADAANTIQNAGYTLVDATVHYDVGKLIPELEGMRFQVNFNNLLDHQYLVCTATTNCTWGLPRTVIGSLTFRW